MELRYAIGWMLPLIRRQKRKRQETLLSFWIRMFYLHDHKNTHSLLQGRAWIFVLCFWLLIFYFCFSFKSFMVLTCLMLAYDILGLNALDEGIVFRAPDKISSRRPDTDHIVQSVDLHFKIVNFFIFALLIWETYKLRIATYYFEDANLVKNLGKAHCSFLNFK